MTISNGNYSAIITAKHDGGFRMEYGYNDKGTSVDAPSFRVREAKTYATQVGAIKAAKRLLELD